MKILVIAPEQLPIPPIKGGSVESCVYQIFSRMAEKHQVTIISRANPSLPRLSKIGNLTIIRISTGEPVSYLNAGLLAVQNENFDIIQIENRPTFVSNVRMLYPRTPIILSLHSLTFMSRLSDNDANYILKQVNGVTSVVSFITNTMKKRFSQHASKFHTAILGVDVNKFSPYSNIQKQQLRRKWKLDKTFNVLFIGRIVPKKGLHTLVKAVSILRKKYPNIKIVAVGSSWPGVKKQTPYMKKVRSLAAKNKIPIVFTGYIPPAKVNEMYHLGDVFVCPTQYQEGFATVNSEAMASEIPVIASNRGGINEVITHHKTGLLVNEYKNPKAYANAIEKLIKKPTLSRQIASNGRKHVKAKLSWNHTVNSLLTHYKSII